MQYWIYFLYNILLASLGRSLDLLSTYRVSPKLKLETNRLISRLGWWGAVLIQIPVIILGGFLFQIALFIFVWSVLISASNISGTWFIKGLEEGETSYVVLLKNSVKKSKWFNVLLDEIAPFILFTAPNLAIWLLIFQFEGNFFYLLLSESIYSYILVITGAAILHGIVGTIRNFLYIMKLKSVLKKEGEQKRLNNI